MLTELNFTNFKSWPHAELECGKITGVFGTNSSGKTSLLQFLLLLKQTKDATDRAIALELNGDLVKLGTIRDAIHQHDEGSTIEARLAFDLPSDLSLGDPSQKRTSTIARGRRLGFEADLYVQQSAPMTRRIAYALGDMRFSLAPRKSDATSFELIADKNGSSAAEFSFKRTLGRKWQLPGPIKSYAFPDQARTYFQNSGFLSDLEATYEAQLDKIFYLGPLRQYPQRDYLWARSRPSDVGQRGEKAIDAILAATDAGEMRNLWPRTHLKPFQEMIAYWLREMGLIDGFKVAEIAEGSNRWQARVRTRPGASEVLLTDVGFGVSQVLPVITLLQYVPIGSTVVLEQPEIHLHPLAQAALADVIIQAAVHRKVQVILESHSEHLLLRLQRRIAGKEIAAEDVKLYFCDAPRGVSTLTPLELDLYGNIRNWPNKFMGDAFGETAEAELARLKWMQAAE
ncbi:MAG: AAA family ATPase [Novosphingobium sp.]